jgi:hypothetical protein
VQTRFDYFSISEKVGIKTPDPVLPLKQGNPFSELSHPHRGSKPCHTRPDYYNVEILHCSPLTPQDRPDS